MKISLSTILLILFLSSAKALFADVKTRIDSLEKALPKAHDTGKFSICYELVRLYQNVDLNKTLIYIEKSIYWAQKNKNILQEAKATKDLGQLFYYRNDYPTAYTYYLRAIKLFNNAYDFKQVSLVYHSIGNLYWTQNKSSKAIDFYLREHKLSETIADSMGIARSLGSIAFIYDKAKEFDKALEMNFRVLDIFIKINSTEYLSASYTNIGILYLKKEMYDKTQEYFYKALQCKLLYEHQRRLDIMYYNIADLYLSMKMYDSASYYYYKSLYISNKFHNTYTGAYIRNGIALLYMKQNKNDSVRYYLDLALSDGKKSNATFALQQIYKSYSKYYSSIDKYKEAYQSLEKYSEITDSLVLDEAMQKVAVYELEKIQASLKIIEKEKEYTALKGKQAKNQRNFLIVFSILILLLSISIYSRFIIKKKSNLALQKVNQTKDKFFTIISHDLKNQLTAFQNISQVLAENFSQIAEEKKQHLVIRINNAAITLYGVLENLLTWSSTQLQGVEFYPILLNFQQVVNNAITELNLQSERKEINLINEVSEAITVCADEDMIRHVLRNLINNSIKFSENKSEIKITAVIKKNMVEVCIIDHGIGISKADQEKLFRLDVNHKEIGTHKEKGSGLGLIIAKEFVEKMGGKIWVESTVGEGSVFSFSLPVNC